jgi:hypothetical protein
MARARKTAGKPASSKRPIEQYDRKGQKRKNNPPVGLVTEATDRGAPKRQSAYDPHLDPILTWAGKAEHTSFQVPTVSLHIHERIDPKTIIEAVRRRNGTLAPTQGSLFESAADIEVRAVEKGEHKGKLEVEMHGFDYYNTKTGQIESGDTGRIALWMLDPDYDGRSLFRCQVFFSMADDDGGWARLARNLRAAIDTERIEAYRGSISLAFEPGVHKRVAIKIVDDRGIESLKIVSIP